MPEITDAELTAIYNEANGITGKRTPITTDRIFAAMRLAMRKERERCIDNVRCIGGPFAVAAEVAIRARAEGEEHGI